MIDPEILNRRCLDQRIRKKKGVLPTKVGKKKRKSENSKSKATFTRELLKHKRKDMVPFNLLLFKATTITKMQKETLVSFMEGGLIVCMSYIVKIWPRVASCSF